MKSNGLGATRDIEEYCLKIRRFFSGGFLRILKIRRFIFESGGFFQKKSSEIRDVF